VFRSGRLPPSAGLAVGAVVGKYEELAIGAPLCSVGIWSLGALWPVLVVWSWGCIRVHRDPSKEVVKGGGDAGRESTSGRGPGNVPWIKHR
jgi:hypothetical protein